VNGGKPTLISGVRSRRTKRAGNTDRGEETKEIS
jgi:hypothetical protein